MPRVIITQEEEYPVLHWQTTWGKGAELSYPMPDVDAETLARWQAAEDAYDAYQRELRQVAMAHLPPNSRSWV